MMFDLKINAHQMQLYQYLKYHRMYQYLTTEEERQHKLIVYQVIWYIYKHDFSLEALFSSILGRKIISGVRLFKA